MEALLAAADRASPKGKRDYAILLLACRLGLRVSDIRGLCLEHLHWSEDRIVTAQTKTGAPLALPLTEEVGGALIDYLRHGRPQTASRSVFLRAVPPPQPVSHAIVSSRARHYLQAAGIGARRPGSHTLRHSCVQRLVDAGFAWKTIGDYAGHRSPKSTEIYTKVAVESLRQVALGDGEEALER